MKDVYYVVQYRTPAIPDWIDRVVVASATRHPTEDAAAVEAQQVWEGYQGGADVRVIQRTDETIGGGTRQSDRVQYQYATCDHESMPAGDWLPVPSDKQADHSHAESWVSRDGKWGDFGFVMRRSIPGSDRWEYTTGDGEWYTSPVAAATGYGEIDQA